MYTNDRSEIIITSRRRPTQVFWQDHRIRFIALDFLRPLEELIEAMRPLCHHVTHAFFASYVHCADFSKLRESNVPLFENFLKSIDYVAGNSLERVVLHTGGKVRAVFILLCSTFNYEEYVLQCDRANTWDYFSTMASTLVLLRLPFTRACSDIKTTERTFTTLRKILCSSWPQSATGTGTSFGPTPSSASPQLGTACQPH